MEKVKLTSHSAGTHVDETYCWLFPYVSPSLDRMANPSLVKLQLTSFPKSSVIRVTVKYTPSHLVGDVVGESEDDGNDDGEVVVDGVVRVARRMVGRRRDRRWCGEGRR